jgi:chorismate dehydratase
VAASSYLNSAPLIWSFARGRLRREVELLTDAAPARCADMLARGEADVALVPTIEYQRIEGLAAVPGVCVGARRAVRSVVLVTRSQDLRAVRSVALDEASRTSAALVRVIFREFYGRELEAVVSRPDPARVLGGSDAALVIGDPAMTFAREGLSVHDLATLWREHTGLGFVFAMWMARARDARLARAVDFAAARDEGLGALEEIVAEYSGELGLPRAELREYLTENIRFHLDEEMRAGLELFYRLAREHGVTDAARPLRTLD